ncbi:MAG: DUF3352 domain-containing protein [Actinomycetota bacterium]|nr:DUF3352 domain-containing protein [Actinomycetota bacterium]
MSRRLPALLAALGALAVGGCGGDGSGGELGSGADLVPADVAYFAAVNTDFEGDQWQAAERLVMRFPAAGKALGELRRDLESDDLDFERDVKPAVGREVDIVVVDAAAENDAVVLTQPKDEEKWRRAVTRRDDPGVTEELEGGWWVAAETQQALDAFESARGGESLAEDDAFNDAIDELPEERLATLYVSGEALTEKLATEGKLDDDDRGALRCLLGSERIPSLAFALAAEEDGAHVSGAVRAEDAEQPDASASGLADKLPAGALAVVSVNSVAEQARAFLRCGENADPEFSQQLGELETVLGLSIDEDILPLFRGEAVLAVYPAAEGGAPSEDASPVASPVVTLATEVDDEDRARRIADQVAALARLGERVETEDVEIAGVRGKRVTTEDTELYYAVFDGLLVATTAEEGIARIREGGDRLADDERFDDARAAAGAPDETTGFLYADVTQAIDLAFPFGVGDEVDGEARRNLEPLRSLFLWGEVDGDVIGFEGFLRID